MQNENHPALKSKENGATAFGASGPVNWRQFIPLFVIAAAILAYFNSFSGEFIFDDHVIITNNPDVRHLSILPLSPRFIVDWTFKLNYLTGGLKPADYHATNLLIHILAALVLFGVIRRTLVLPSFNGRFDADSELLAGISTILWVTHPLQTQSVTYICQRYESMMGLCVLLCLYCFIRASDSVRARFWSNSSITFCAIGMGTKESMIVAPFLVLAFDYVLLSGSIRELVRSRGRVHLALFATAGILLLLLLLAAARKTGLSSTFGQMSSGVYLMNQCEVVLYYLRLALFPHPLCLDYAWQPSFSGFKLLPWCLVVGAAFAWSVAASIRKQPMGLVCLYFFALLSPSSSVIPLVDLASEHRMYLPLAAVITGLIVSTYGFMQRFLRYCSGVVFRRFVLSCIMFLLLIFIYRTNLRNSYYRSAEIMWRDVLVNRPLNPRANLGIGCELFTKGLHKEAEAYFLQVVKNDASSDGLVAGDSPYATEWAMAYGNLGVIRFEEGKYAEAARLFRRALKFGVSETNERNLQNALKMQQ